MGGGCAASSPQNVIINMEQGKIAFFFSLSNPGSIQFGATKGIWSQQDEHLVQHLRDRALKNRLRLYN